MPETPLRRRTLFTAITVAVPIVVLVLLEAGLRIAGYGAGASLFATPTNADSRWIAARPDIARRYFPNDPSPPTPPLDLFLRDKPAGGYRVFVLGESTTAGFPYPANGSFAGIIEDALGDMLPGAAVEVINLGISATNTYTIVDLLPEILAQSPDAIVLYAGHNEYYGALGAASTARIASSPAITRALLRVKRLRTAQLMGKLVRPLVAPPSEGPRAPGRMEELAANADIQLGSDTYQAGLDQFATNMDEIAGTVADAGIPLFIGSLASNLRSFAPFAAGRSSGRARTLFDSATTLARLNHPQAPNLFAAARDADPIRFRAPTAFNDIIARTATRRRSIYVATAEALARVDGGAPGDSLFFEHVHPRPAGTARIAQAFLDSMMNHPSLRNRIRGDRRRALGDYERRMSLTAVDSTIATLMVTSLMQRWPFVDRERATNHLATFAPATRFDSLAMDVLTGRATWTEVKLRQATLLVGAGEVEEALAEYAGLMRDQPWNESPFRFAGRMLLEAGHPDAAEGYLERAHAIDPSAFSAFALALIASREDSLLGRAEALLLESLRRSPGQPQVLYQLSLTYGRRGNLAAARATAQQVAQLAPGFPGLREWMRVLGAP